MLNSEQLVKLLLLLLPLLPAGLSQRTELPLQRCAPARTSTGLYGNVCREGGLQQTQVLTSVTQQPLFFFSDCEKRRRTGRADRCFDVKDEPLLLEVLVHFLVNRTCHAISSAPPPEAVT